MSREKVRALGCMTCPLASGKCVSDIHLQFLDRGSRLLACIAGSVILAFAEEVVGGLLFKVLSKHLNHQSNAARPRRLRSTGRVGFYLHQHMPFQSEAVGGQKTFLACLGSDLPLPREQARHGLNATEHVPRIRVLATVLENGHVERLSALDLTHSDKRARCGLRGSDMVCRIFLSNDHRCGSGTRLHSGNARQAQNCADG